MRAPEWISAVLLGLGLVACDDTGRAIRDEVKEIDTREVKRELKGAAATVGSAAEKAGRKVDEAAPKVLEGMKQGVKDVAEETEKVIDKIDKKAAQEIREPEKK